ncbi:TIGR02466 family protein [Lamprobacter modestohalophilus]|uniref:TIGR02466 family protein n=1 Tax=Lamprobacter modestohalophilus TaxID=1064514 RepID=UPI002ADED3C5|nr:TIGR02466 family protein [Lamprobacter modestohalophilus]MEA1051740.1 TIGR02466 family protein [Lamprobacter modestohalophilus]
MPPIEDTKFVELQSTTLAQDPLFPSLVFRQEILGGNEFNHSLLRFILNERATDSTGVQNSNVAALGGWHSRRNLQNEAVLQPLVTTISNAAETIGDRLAYHPRAKVRLDQMWAIVNPPGAYNSEHLHPHALWSGVYYVQAPADSGDLKFSDPRPGNVMFCAQHHPAKAKPSEARLSITYQPMARHLILFPGFLPHSVNVNQSAKSGHEALRIAISFNLTQH